MQVYKWWGFLWRYGKE